MIIGITGPNAAGKGEAAAYLGSLGYAYHSLSDVLRDELAAQGVEPTRENLIAIGNRLRGDSGPGVLAERILSRLGRRDVVDSIRNPAEVDVLRRREDFVLIGVDAPLDVRFARAMARGRPGDGPSLEEFSAREARENSPDPSRQQLARTFAMADVTISNGGTLEDLHRAVEAALRGLEGRGAAQTK